jgi:ParB-like chromosome segregation protein Spo0J
VNWLAHTKTRLLDPHEIDLEDTTYLIPCFSRLDALECSIARLGIVNPPLLQERSAARLIPVLGRRRLAVALKLGIPQVESRVIPLGMSEQEGFQIAFWDNIAFRTFDPACAAMVVKRLMELFSRAEVAKDFLQVLNVPQHGPRLERLIAVGSLEFSVLDALASGRIHEKTAWLLSKLEPHERAGLLKLCEELSLNANKSAEVIEGLVDLSIFQGKPILQFLEQEAVRKILSDPDLARPQRAEFLRDLVRSWKFPELVARERDFRNKIAELVSSHPLVVRPTAGFESPECTLEIRCESVEQAAGLVARMKDES